MSYTPITDAALFLDKGKYTGSHYAGANTVDCSRKLERELNAANARIDYLTNAFRREQNDIEQTCGKALGYPRFCDDQENFPGSTEADGVCIGDHVAASIAAELANKYAAAMERIKRLEEAGDKMHWAFMHPFDTAHESVPDAWTKAKEAKP